MDIPMAKVIKRVSSALIYERWCTMMVRFPSY